VDNLKKEFILRQVMLLKTFFYIYHVMITSEVRKKINLHKKYYLLELSNSQQRGSENTFFWKHDSDEQQLRIMHNFILQSPL